VLVAPGTYQEKIDFLGKAISVKGEQGAEYTYIDGNLDGYVVTFKHGEQKDSVLDGFTLFNGCNFYSSYGGGLYLESSHPVITQCIIKLNRGHYGGGMRITDSNPTIDHCIFTSNYANSGGAIYNKNSNPIITDCLFINNKATFTSGGGVYNEVNGHSEFTRCDFRNNFAATDGGGILAYGDLSLIDCAFINNESNGEGGGIRNILNNIVILNCCFTENTSRKGGGMYNGKSIGLIEDTIFYMNSAVASSGNAGSGGGMYIVDGSLTVNNCVFNENSTNDYASYFEGGGVWVGSGEMKFTNCCFNSNTAGSAGGMYIANCSCEVTNSIFYKNHGRSWGGGMVNYGAVSNRDRIIRNCIFTENSTDGVNFNCGGLILIDYEDLSETIIFNTIFWNNHAPSNPGSEIWVGINNKSAKLSISYSDVKGGYSSVYVNYKSTVNWGDGMIDDDPLFNDASINDLHLTYPSPCRDTGDNNSVTELCDFEGNPRIAYGTVDMGADEFYTHLYVTGDKTPGGSIQGKFVGLPDTNSVGLFIGSGILPTPATTMWGEYWLQAPWFLFPLVPIPSNGILELPKTLPSSIPAPYDIPMQALIGLNANSLTSLCVLEVR
jgi:predicted outer membrane repeat protein